MRVINIGTYEVGCHQYSQVDKLWTWGEGCELEGWWVKPKIFFLAKVFMIFCQDMGETWLRGDEQIRLSGQYDSSGSETISIVKRASTPNVG